MIGIALLALLVAFFRLQLWIEGGVVEAAMATAVAALIVSVTMFFYSAHSAGVPAHHSVAQFGRMLSPDVGHR